MAELTISLPEELRTKMGSKLLGRALIKLIKRDIFERFMETRTLSEADQEFCDKIDWYPVDELEVKEEYVKELEKARNEPSEPMTIEELDKLMGLE